MRAPITVVLDTNLQVGSAFVFHSFVCLSCLQRRYRRPGVVEKVVFNGRRLWPSVGNPVSVHRFWVFLCHAECRWRVSSSDDDGTRHRLFSCICVKGEQP